MDLSILDAATIRDSPGPFLPVVPFFGTMTWNYQKHRSKTILVREPLEELADLIRETNIVSGKISAITNRPTSLWHAGEYLASHIFDIELHQNARQQGSDGHFRSGPLQKRTVNIKWYPKQEGILAIKRKYRPDFYLVLTGPLGAAESSRGKTRPWVIEHVYLFETLPLMRDLRAHLIKIGKEATSIRTELWIQAEIYPIQANTTLLLTAVQCRRLQLFRGSL
jgi:hypothetical protein